MTNALVIQWICDQTAGIIEFLTALFCFVIIVRAIRHGKFEFHHTCPKSFKTAIYTVYISTMFHGVSVLFGAGALSMAAAIYPPSTGYQRSICFGTFLLLFPTFVIQQVAIVILFVIRLDVAFQGTVLELPKCVNYTFRVGYPALMIVINIATLIVVDPVPYNIYKDEVDLNGSGVTCSPFAEGAPTPLLALLVGLNGIGIIGANITVWVLFIKRLYRLVQLESIRGRANDGTFVQFMKEQTFIACVAVSLTFFAWGFNTFLALGAILIGIDISLTCFVIFLSFKFNRRYYLMLKCDKITNVCCGTCFDRMIGDTEKEMIEVVTIQKTQSAPPGSNGHTVTPLPPSIQTGSDQIQIK